MIYLGTAKIISGARWSAERDQDAGSSLFCAAGPSESRVSTDGAHRDVLCHPAWLSLLPDSVGDGKSRFENAINAANVLGSAADATTASRAGQPITSSA